MAATAGQGCGSDWRSLLYVPATADRFVAKAHTRGADAIILDLEDSVAPSEKRRARTLVSPAAGRIAGHGIDVLVRINRPWRLALRDLEAVVGPHVTGLLCPKTGNAAHLRVIAEVLDDLEAERGLCPGHTRLVAMVETADAFFRAHEIARATPRLCAMVLGTEDFAADVGLEPTADTLQMPKQLVAIAARAAGLQPLGFLGTVADYEDLAAFREVIRRSRRFGFSGATCIHPGQVTVLNAEFAPSPGEVAHAERLVAAHGAALAAGKGAVAFEGRMIDAPVVERARRLIARAALRGGTEC